MSGKRRKQQQRSRGRRPDTGVAPRPVDRSPAVTTDGAATGASAGSPATPVPAATTSRPAAASRYASSVSGPRRTAAATTATGTIDIDERVPYFAKDLRRIVITATIMVVVIIAGSLLLH